MKIKPVFLVCAILFIAVCTASLLLGAEKITLAEFFGLFGSANTQNPPIDPFVRIIVIDIRLVRTCAAFLCGALLGIAGTIFQGLFRNNLADPYMMGVSSGATLGAVFAGFTSASLSALPRFFSGPVPLALCAFLGALLSVYIVYIIASKSKHMSSVTALLLVGAALSAFFSAITSLLLLVRDKELYKIYMWTMGTFNGKTTDDILCILPFAALACILSFIVSRPLDILSSGESSAQSLGLNVRKIRPVIIASGALATASAVAIGGTIGFVGLIAPHIARILFGASQRKLLPASAYIGGMLLLIADIAARTLASPTEIPVGIITALMGAPFFIWLLINKTQARR